MKNYYRSYHIIDNTGNLLFPTINAINLIIRKACIKALEKNDYSYTVDNYLKETMTPINYRYFYNNIIDCKNKLHGSYTFLHLVHSKTFWASIRETFPNELDKFFIAPQSKNTEFSDAPLFTIRTKAFLHSDNDRGDLTYDRFPALGRYNHDVYVNSSILDNSLVQKKGLHHVLKLPALYNMTLVMNFNKLSDTEIDYSNILDTDKNYPINLTLNGALTNYKNYPEYTQAFMYASGTYEELAKNADSFENLPWNAQYTFNNQDNKNDFAIHSIRKYFQKNESLDQDFARVLKKNTYQYFSSLHGKNIEKDYTLLVAKIILDYYKKDYWLANDVPQFIFEKKSVNVKDNVDNAMAKVFARKYKTENNHLIFKDIFERSPEDYVHYLWNRLFRNHSEPINPYYLTIYQEYLKAYFKNEQVMEKVITIDAKIPGAIFELSKILDNNPQEMFNTIIRTGNL